jgi:ABC-type multidrug transport system ATPase subunit
MRHQAPSAFRACVRKNLILATRGARAGPSDRAGPLGVLAWRALTQAALVACVFGVLRSADTGRPAPLPARAFPPSPLGLPTWADAYGGPALRTHWRGTLAVCPGGDGGDDDESTFTAKATALAAALACGWGSADGSPPSGGRPSPAASLDPASRSFRSLWRRPPGGGRDRTAFPDPVGAVCAGGGAPCAAERACWAHLLMRPAPPPPTTRPPPGLILYPSWAAAIAAASSAWPDTFDAVAGLGWGGGGGRPRYAVAANATLLPPALAAVPGSAGAGSAGSSGSALDPPSPHKAAWFVANLQAALEGAAAAGGGGGVNLHTSTPTPIPLLSFKPFPAPATTADATALLVGAMLQLALAYAALAPGRRAASSLAGEAGAQRAALAAAGLPGSLYWLSWAAAHALEAAAAAAAFGAAAALAVPAKAALLAALLAGAATVAVVAGAYTTAAALSSRGPTAAADAFTAGYVILALPGYLAGSLPAGSRAAETAWVAARFLPPSSAVLAGAGAGTAAGVARVGGGWAAMLRAPATPGGAGGPGAPSVGGILVCLTAQAVVLALLAAALDAAAAQRAGGRRGAGALPRPCVTMQQPASDADAEGGPLLLDPYPLAPAAEAVDLVKIYPAHGGATAPTTALAGLSLTAPRAAVTALLGPSGAGKSTAVSCLTGEAAPTAGVARMGGVEPDDARQAGVSVGLCPQADVAWPSLTVRDHLQLWAAVKGAPSTAAAARDAIASAASIGLAPKLDARASELSGGQRRALATAAALLRAPDVVVLDEPTAGLDAAARARVWGALAARPRGTGALLATHALEEVEAAADDAVVIGGGRALAAGAPADLQARFGGGYRLAVSWAERTGSGAADATAAASEEDPGDAVAALVSRAAPGAVRHDERACAAGTARFRLGGSDAPAFPALLRALSAAGPGLGLTGVALSVAPLEDAVAALTADAAGNDGGGVHEGMPGELPLAALSSSSLPPRTPPGLALTTTRIAALARSALCAARRRAGAEAWAVFTAASAIGFGAYLAASMAAGTGSGSRGPAGPPLALGRAGALAGHAALLGGAPSTAPSLPALAAALGPPNATILPGATSPGPGGFGPPPPESMDAALLDSWWRGAPAYDAMFTGWPGLGGAVLLANGSAPAGLFGAVASAVPALLAVGRAGDGRNASPSATTSPLPPVLIPLAPGSSALVSAVAAAAGGWLFAFELVTATAVAAGSAGRRAAMARAGGSATQARLAGAGAGVSLTSAALAEGARAAVWLGAGLAATALLGPPNLSSPAPLAALAALGAGGAAAAVLAAWIAARMPAVPDPEAAALGPGRAAWAAIGASAGVGALRFAPLLLPARTKLLRAAATTLHLASATSLPPYNLLRGVLAVALVDEAESAGGGGGSGQADPHPLASIRAFRPLRLSPHPAPLAWSAAGQPLACLAAQVVAFTLVALWAEGRPEGEGAGMGPVVRGVAAMVRKNRRVPGGGGGTGGPESESLLMAGEEDGDSGGGDAGAAAERAACVRLAASPAPPTLLVAGAAKAFPAGPAGGGGRGGSAATLAASLFASPTTTRALRGAWLHAAPGECVGVVGANGAGKTTLFRLVVGELEPDAGAVLVAGAPAAGGRGVCGYCPQGASLPPGLSPIEAVAALALLRGVARGAASGAAAALLTTLGLPTSASTRPISTLSGGQARRAGVAAALVGAPPLVVLDEPSTGLDAASRARLWATVRGVCGERSAVLVSSHRLEELDAVCGRVAVLVGGRLAAVGAPAALRAAYGGGVRVRVLPASPDGPAAAAAEAAAAALGAPLSCISLEPGGKAAVLRLEGDGGVGGLALADVYERLEAARAGGLVGGFSASGASLEDAFLVLAGRRVG